MNNETNTKIPLYVLEDENGDLFLSTEETCGDSSSPVELHDHSLWDAYWAACRAMNKAKQAVRSALLVPLTQETLTIYQIDTVKRWAEENGKRGLYADAVRCEVDGLENAPHGAKRRICAHLKQIGKTPA